MTNTTADITSKRAAVVSKIKRYSKPALITTAVATAAYVVIKQDREFAEILTYHQQRINDLIESNNQLLEDVRNLQA